MPLGVITRVRLVGIRETIGFCGNQCHHLSAFIRFLSFPRLTSCVGHLQVFWVCAQLSDFRKPLLRGTVNERPNSAGQHWILDHTFISTVSLIYHHALQYLRISTRVGVGTRNDRKGEGQPDSERIRRSPVYSRRVNGSID